MTALIKNLIDNKDSEDGFSLIELIVVVAILGILVAIAIPVYGNIQTTARRVTLDTVAANSATTLAAYIASYGVDSELFDSLDIQNGYSYSDGTTSVGAAAGDIVIPTDADHPATVNTATDNIFVAAIKNTNPEDIAWAGTAVGSGHSW